MGRLLLKFSYVNWRGTTHEYVIEPWEVSMADGHFMLHGACTHRDGEPREGTPRRSFQLIKIVDLEEVWEHELNASG